MKVKPLDMYSSDFSKQTIMVIDDDQRLRDLLKRFLIDHDFHVLTAESAIDARQKLEMIHVDLLVLDIMMPGENGFDFCKTLRQGNQFRDIPVLMLTAMGEADNRINGLEMGADDYLGKPFEPRELVLRIRNILKRQNNAIHPGIINIGSVKFDAQRKCLFNETTEISLTDNETSLLSFLTNKMGQIVSRESLLAIGGDDINTRSIDVQINRLRKKLEIDPKNPRHLQTLRGKGYKLLP